MGCFRRILQRFQFATADAARPTQQALPVATGLAISEEERCPGPSKLRSNKHMGGYPRKMLQNFGVTQSALAHGNSISHRRVRGK